MMSNNDAVKSVNGGEGMDFFTPNDATMDFFGDGFSFFGSSDEPAQPQQEEAKKQDEPTVEPPIDTQPPEQKTEKEIESKQEDNNEEAASDVSEDSGKNDDEGTIDTDTTASEEKPEKKIRRRRGKKATLKTEDDCNNDAALDDKNVSVKNTRNAKAPESDEVFTIPVNPHLDIRNIVSSLNLIPDTSFAEAQKDIQAKMNAIKVERNIDKANIMLMYDLVDELSDILRARYAVVKTIYDNLINKDVGIIANVRKLNTVGTGTVADKERNAILCLVNYKTDDMAEPVNLIQLAWAASYEYNFIESAIDQLETKRRLLRGMEDALV